MQQPAPRPPRPMTSRERVEAALNFREPDRVPVDCSGMRSTGIAAVAYGHLKRHLGLDGEPPHVYDVGQMLAEIEEPVRRRFQFDIVPLEPWRSTWRTREGVGQWIDACLLDSAVAMMSVIDMNYLVSDVVPSRAGNAHQLKWADLSRILNMRSST